MIRKCCNWLCPDFQARLEDNLEQLPEYIECDNLCEHKEYIPLNALNDYGTKN